MSSAHAALANNSQDSLWTGVPGAVTEDGFCAAWIVHQCQLIGGVSAASVLIGAPDEGPYKIKGCWPPGDKVSDELNASAEQTIRERSPLIIQRKVRSSPGGAIQEFHELAYPILIGPQLFGVVVLRLTPRSSAALQTALQQLSWGAAWLEVMLERQRYLESERQKERLQGVLHALAVVVEEKSFHRAATALVADLATRLFCERVSLGFRDEDRINLQAISHNARFGKRTNLSRAIEAAMEEACDQETPILYPPSSDRLCSIAQHHQELAQRHGSSAICSVPLGREGEIYGVLTLERLADRPLEGATVEMCETIAALVGPILEMKKRDERPLRIRGVDAIRERWNAVVGPDHAAAKFGSAVAAAVILFFIFANGQYRVSTKMLIEAQSQRVAVAPFNGYIATARARPGDTVQAGEILATLDTRDLNLEQLKWLSQKEQYGKQYNVALAQQNASQVKIAAAQVAQAEAELALIEDQISRAHLLAPIDGVVISGDLSQSMGAPTERGQILYEVAPLNTYRVVLQVDERDAAEVVVGQRGDLALAAFPTRPLPFRVQKITPVSAASEGRNYFRVEAALEKALPQLRPGMEGVAKIEIGRRRLIWIWTHRALDWLRLFAWSWAP